MPKYLEKLSCVLYSAIFMCQITTGHASHELTDAQNIYHNAILSNPLIDQIHKEGQQLFELEAGYLRKLIDDNKSLFNNSSINHEKLYASVKSILQEEVNHITALNDQLKTQGYKAGNRGATYQLLTNKMQFILKFALDLADQENLFFDIMDGKLPSGYSIDTPLVNYFPQDEHIYSNGKHANALKTLLVITRCVLKDNGSLQDLFQSDEVSLDDHPFMHILQLPSDIDKDGINKSRFHYSDTQTNSGLITIHNGFAFGGHRGESRYPNGKKWGPQDCSSFVAKQTGCKQPFSTYDQAYLYQAKQGFAFPESNQNILKEWRQTRLPEWQATKAAEAVNERYTPISWNFDHQKLKPGLVHLERVYRGVENNQHIALSGTGGHTGIYLGTIGSESETAALTISANRDLEDTGREFVYGIEKRLLFSNDSTKVMFFDVNKQK